MAHILDNITWNALNTGNKNLAIGNEYVKLFPETVSPFVGMKEISTNNFSALHSLIDSNRTLGIFTPDPINIPPDWNIIREASIAQMICEKPLMDFEKQDSIVPLSSNNIDEMIALTKLTNPGPFEKETILFGHYEGIFIDGKLAAMAGQRMNPTPFAEISAVCTHPDFHGRGLATQLLKSQIKRIQSQNETPVLHVFPENATAISVYEKLGFRIRREVFIYIITKK